MVLGEFLGFLFWVEPGDALAFFFEFVDGIAFGFFGLGSLAGGEAVFGTFLIFSRLLQGLCARFFALGLGVLGCAVFVGLLAWFASDFLGEFLGLFAQFGLFPGEFFDLVEAFGSFLFCLFLESFLFLDQVFGLFDLGVELVECALLVGDGGAVVFEFLLFVDEFLEFLFPGLEVPDLVLHLLEFVLFLEQDGDEVFDIADDLRLFLAGGFEFLAVE